MAEPNTRLSGVKQELSLFKSEFSSSFEKLKDSITVKSSDINARLDEIEKKTFLYMSLQLSWRQLAFHFQCKTLFTIMIYIDTTMTKCNSSIHL